MLVIIGKIVDSLLTIPAIAAEKMILPIAIVAVAICFF
jgi:hypothetical protein